jgi:hypothetical protein
MGRWVEFEGRVGWDFRSSVVTQFEVKILSALMNAGGEIDLKTYEELCTEKGDGYKHAGMVRRGLTEWVRGHMPRSLNATGVRITERGRHALLASYPVAADVSKVAGENK